MSIKDKDLKEIAYLARINIRKEDFSSLKKDLEEILSLVEEMNESDTSNTEAMSHPLDISQPLREDVVTEPDNRERNLTIAPSTKYGLFLVPKVIEGDK